MQIGICDWTLKMPGDYRAIETARQMGFDGLQLSLNCDDAAASVNPSNVLSFKTASEKHQVQMCSAAAVNFLQRPFALVPDASDIFSGYFELLHQLEISVVLLPFFGRSDINPKAPLKSKIVKLLRRLPTNSELYRRTIESMKNIALLAEKFGITIGMETLLDADQAKRMIDEIDSPFIKVFYDTGNAVRMKYNVPEEIRRLGQNYICQIHLKEFNATLQDQEKHYMDIIEALYSTGYNTWIVIENTIRSTEGLKNSMHSNIEFLRGCLQPEANR